MVSTALRMLIKAGWWLSISASFQSEPAGGAVVVFVSRLLCLSHSIDWQMQMRGAAQQNINVGLAGGAADLASRPRVQYWSSVLCCCTGARDHSITKQASHSVLMGAEGIDECWKFYFYITLHRRSLKLQQQRPPTSLLCGKTNYLNTPRSEMVHWFALFVFSHSWTFYATRKFWERTTLWNLLLWQDGDLRWVPLQKDEFCGKNVSSFMVSWVG